MIDIKSRVKIFLEAISKAMADPRTVPVTRHVLEKYYLRYLSLWKWLDGGGKPSRKEIEKFEGDNSRN